MFFQKNPVKSFFATFYYFSLNSYDTRMYYANMIGNIRISFVGLLSVRFISVNKIVY